MSSAVTTARSRRGLGQEPNARDSTLPSRNTPWPGAELSPCKSLVQSLCKSVWDADSTYCSSLYGGEKRGIYFLLSCNQIKVQDGVFVSFLKVFAAKPFMKPLLFHVLFTLAGIRGRQVWQHLGEQELWWWQHCFQMLHKALKWQPSLQGAYLWGCE